MELNIAVVDDLPEDRDCIKGMLEQYFSADEWTVSITEYDSAEQFLQTYRKGAFHIIFLDIYMGEIGGIELSKRVRTGDANIEIMYIIIVIEIVTIVLIFHAYDKKPFIKQ